MVDYSLCVMYNVPMFELHSLKTKCTAAVLKTQRPFFSLPASNILCTHWVQNTLNPMLYVLSTFFDCFVRWRHFVYLWHMEQVAHLQFFSFGISSEQHPNFSGITLSDTPSCCFVCIFHCSRKSTKCRQSYWKWFPPKKQSWQADYPEEP